MPSPPPSGTWSIGAVARATGLGEHTLRAWERRFGFPRPLRTPSGHRRYPTDQVERLRLVSRLLELGHRPRDVVALPAERLHALLDAARPAGGAGWLERGLDLVRERRPGALAAHLRTAISALGVEAAVEERIAPLLRRVGDAWASGRLDVGHEHLAAQAAEDVLREERRRLEPALEGPVLLLATLPGELHALGLQIAAVGAALSGWSPRLLGPDTPVEAIADTAAAVGARAVGISVSAAADLGTVERAIFRLRELLAPGVAVIVGGAGASGLTRLPDRVTPVSSLPELRRALEAAAGSAPLGAAP